MKKTTVKVIASMEEMEQRSVRLSRAKYRVAPENKMIRNGKAVICINDGKLFKSAREAANYYGVEYSTLTRVCTGDRHIHSIGNGLKFSYVADLAYKVNDITDCITELKAKAISADVAKFKEVLYNDYMPNETKIVLMQRLIG